MLLSSLSLRLTGSPIIVGQIRNKIAVAIEEDVMKTPIASPCHDAEQVVGNAIRARLAVLFMGVHKPPVVAVGTAGAARGYRRCFSAACSSSFQSSCTGRNRS